MKEERNGRRPLHEVDSILGQPMKRFQEQKKSEKRNKFGGKIVSEKKNNKMSFLNFYLINSSLDDDTNSCVSPSFEDRKGQKFK
jgi:hypothetical protein